MLPSVSALKPAVECASPCPFAAGVSAAVIAVWDDMEEGLYPSIALHNAGTQGYTPGANAWVRLNSGLRYALYAWATPAAIPLPRGNQIVTCVPTSTTRPVGIWK